MDIGFIGLGNMGAPMKPMSIVRSVPCWQFSWGATLPDAGSGVTYTPSCAGFAGIWPVYCGGEVPQGMKPLTISTKVT